MYPPSLNESSPFSADNDWEESAESADWNTEEASLTGADVISAREGSGETFLGIIEANVASALIIILFTMKTEGLKQSEGGMGVR